MKEKSARNSKFLKTYNRILIRNIIRKMGPISRHEVAKEVGLTPPTVTVIVNELIEDRIVQEVGYGKSSGGRRPVMLELNPKAAYIFAVRLQRGEAVTALFDLGGNVLNHHKRTLDTTDADEVLEALGNSFDWLINDTGIEKRMVLGCGLASPGLINIQRGVIVHSSNLQWDQVPLGAMLSKRLYGIPVHVENISNAAALAEKEYGSGRGYHNLIYINLSVGVGAGIIIDGEIYHGSRGYAGEIGHANLIPKRGPQCICGRSGCIEAICGVRAILERMKEEIPEEVFEKHGLHKNKLNTQDLFLPALLENIETKRILHETGEWVGIVAANLVSIFNPSLIILGGEVPETGDEFAKTVVETMNQYVLKEFVGTAKVVNSSMEEDPPLLGVYTLALEDLFSIENWDY
jgi:N-acetylglucosamine repressor